MAVNFSCQRRVEFCETDAAGIVHFSSLMIYMEQAEHALLRSLGLSVALSATSHSIWPDPVLHWPRVRAECDFLSPARFEDNLLCLVSVARLGSKSVTFRHLIQSGRTDIASGSMTSVCCQRKNAQSDSVGSLIGIEVPADVREKLNQFLA